MSSKFELAFKVNLSKVSVEKLSEINDLLNNTTYMKLQTWDFKVDNQKSLLIYTFTAYIEDLTQDEQNDFTNIIRPEMLKILGVANVKSESQPTISP